MIFCFNLGNTNNYKFFFANNPFLCLIYYEHFYNKKIIKCLNNLFIYNIIKYLINLNNIIY